MSRIFLYSLQLISALLSSAFAMQQPATDQPVFHFYGVVVMDPKPREGDRLTVTVNCQQCEREVSRRTVEGTKFTIELRPKKRRILSPAIISSGRQSAANLGRGGRESSSRRSFLKLKKALTRGSRRKLEKEKEESTIERWEWETVEEIGILIKYEQMVGVGMVGIEVQEEWTILEPQVDREGIKVQEEWTILEPDFSLEYSFMLGAFAGNLSLRAELLGYPNGLFAYNDKLVVRALIGQELKEIGRVIFAKESVAEHIKINIPLDGDFLTNRQDLILLNLSIDREIVHSNKKTKKECSICLDNFERKDEFVYGNKCDEKHIFHENCLEKWHYKKGDGNQKKCPVCKHPMVLSIRITIFDPILSNENFHYEHKLINKWVEERNDKCEEEAFKLRVFDDELNWNFYKKRMEIAKNALKGEMERGYQVAKMKSIRVMKRAIESRSAETSGTAQGPAEEGRE